jgi:hypothetical protein
VRAAWDQFLDNHLRQKQVDEIAVMAKKHAAEACLALNFDRTSLGVRA